MNNLFKEILASEIKDNPFKLIAQDWMLITAGTMESYNTMTASWGGMGVVWGKDMCVCFVRPSRHTYKFMEEAQTFTLSVFDEKYRDALVLCGTKSGRDMDKAAAAGITPVKSPMGGVCFAEARLVIECKKMYYHDFDPSKFLLPEIEDNYDGSDYHRMYIGEVIKCLEGEIA